MAHLFKYRDVLPHPAGGLDLPRRYLRRQFQQNRHRQFVVQKTAFDVS